MQRRPKIFAT